VKKLFVRRKGMEKEFTDIAIPTTLYKKIEEKIKGTEFPSVASYVAKVMDDSLSQEQAFSKEDEEKVKDRLKALGYID
jgi:hypothetical protein